jgi:ATP-dependent DNA helicase UvrD/PcrA
MGVHLLERRQLMIDDVLQGLTESQVQAVTYGNGPLLVVAGAGSGKTRVITRRVAWLAANGVSAYRILAITFTNKAATEMKGRVAEMTGAGGAWVSTFHSMCARMLRQFSDLLGFSNPFTIYDRKDSLDCVKLSVGQLGLGETQMKPAAFLNAISRAKNQMLMPDDLAQDAKTEREELEARVYGAYVRLCRTNQALDFDDLLMRTAQLLEGNDSFRDYWRERFDHVLIDEYQDTNRPQYVIARQISGGHRNICATGDPDQSIYGWRGADINNILDFQKDYPDAVLVKLEENFRSTKMILKAASGVIKRNRARIERGLWTHNAEGSPVAVVGSHSDIDEADAVVDGIEENRQAGIEYGGMAVFYRTHAQSRVVEASLRDAGVPYAILDAVEFYNRKEVKDVVSYLKAMVNPADGVSLRRVINEPKRGIGATTVKRLGTFAAAEEMTFDEAIAAVDRIPTLAARAKTAVTRFGKMMAKVRELDRSPVADVVRGVLAETGFLKSLRDSGADEDAARAENVEELVNAAAEFDMDYPDADLEMFLERVTLVSDSDALTGEGGQVMLMTLHSAKGLEFPVVFIVGVQEGLLPHINSQGSKTRIEEERRLCYVGMTRAKQKLYLHWASESFVYGQIGVAQASRFIREMPDDARTGAVEGVAPSMGGLFGGGFRPSQPTRRPEPRRVEVGKDRVIEYDDDVVEYDDGSPLRPGERVQHATFGRGQVVAITGSGDRTTVVVDFNGRKRHLMLQFANLVRLG